MSEQERTQIITLVKDAGKGNKQAFEPLYRYTVSSVRSVCACYFQSGSDIDDALQETYVRIFRGLHTLEAPEAFFSWSRTIARNTCLNMIRSRNLVNTHETGAGLFQDDDGTVETLTR